MEIGLMGSPAIGEEEIAYELGIKHCNVGLYGATLDADPIYKEIERLAQMNMEPLGIITPVKEEINQTMFFHDFGKKIRWIAKTYPMVEYFEIWPEPSCPYVSGKQWGLRDYVSILQCAYENIKEVRGDSAVVYNGGMGQHGTMWSTYSFLKHGIDFIDGFNLHPFMFDGNPKRVIELISGLVSRSIMYMADVGKPKPLVITEWGVPTAHQETCYGSHIDVQGIPGLLYEHQAQIVGEVLTMLDRICLRLHFAYIKDVEPEVHPEDQGMVVPHHWGSYTGLVTYDGWKKPAFYTVKEIVAAKRRAALKWAA